MVTACADLRAGWPALERCGPSSVTSCAVTEPAFRVLAFGSLAGPETAVDRVVRVEVMAVDVD